MSGRAGRGLLLVGVAALVLVAVVAGFLVLGTPGDERLRRFDEKRVSDLQTIRTAVIEHFYRTGALPDSLAELAWRGPGAAVLSDPATGDRYAYQAFDDSTFQLCATFDHPSETALARAPFDRWGHDSGYGCYEFRLGQRPPHEVEPSNPPRGGP